jgi:hypothetical protein
MWAHDPRIELHGPGVEQGDPRARTRPTSGRSTST